MFVAEDIKKIGHKKYVKLINLKIAHSMPSALQALCRTLLIVTQGKLINVK